MDQPLNIWGKLVSLHPDKENINFFIKPNEKNVDQIDDACKIYQDTLGNTWIKGMKKKALTKVNNAWLGTSKKKMLLGGETVSFHVETAFETKRFEYIFCLVNTEPEDKLKRKKEESLEHISTAFGQVSQKLIKVEGDLEKELSCTICMEILHRCVTLTPCQHSFCSSCLFGHLKISSNCPLCTTKAVYVAKSLVIQNLLEVLSNSFPNLQKLQNDSSKQQIELRGNIVRHQNGIYVGDFANQKKEGKGVYLYNDGEIYDGGWKNDKKDGQGILKYEDGVIFKGKWLNDVMEPLGEIRYPNGNTYQGEIKNLMKHGKGVFKWPCGDSYDGNFHEGLREGFGKYFYKTGGEYEGNWIRGNRDGHGAMKYANGNIYNGEWKINLREGKGIWLLKNGDTLEGDWVSNVLQPQVKIGYLNGDIYEGEINPQNVQKHGKGVLTLKNGNKNDGFWENDKFMVTEQLQKPAENK